MHNCRIHTVCNTLLRGLVLIILSAFPSSFIAAQCASPINTFPYKEDFETTDGNWLPGGVLPDWAWGKPAKPIINSAGSGQKCWITGGLNGSFYNLGEQSWLQSPCFDFSSVQHPYISFKVFWETESKFDGATIEYSTDNGNNWQVLGSINDARNCLNGNWYNNPSIFKLPQGQGWCGSKQAGDGSGVWVTAQHTLPYLAGMPKVIFRFFFGAGIVQNNYDGFAIDDITIGEAPANNADFIFTCLGNNTVSFTDASANCPTSYTWDFDDPASGAANSSSSAIPSHTFTAAGTYNVSLTVKGPDNAPSTIIKQVSIISLSAGASTSVSCNGDNSGSATVIATGGVGGYSYKWNTVPPQNNATAINLSAGTYTVTVSSTSSCTASKDFVITEPLKLTTSLTTQPAQCTSNTGSVTAVISGGTGPYTYLWTPANTNTPVINNVSAGKYYLTVTDKNGCSINDSAVVKNVNTLAVTLSTQPAQCTSNTGSVTAVISGGTNPYTYLWTPANTNTPVINNVSAGKYYLTVTDKNGCSINDSAVVNDINTLALALTPTSSVCGNSNGSVTSTITGGTQPYIYSWIPANTNTPAITNIPAGKYYLTVTDINGCLVTDSTNVKDTNTLKISLEKDTTICQGDMIRLTPGTFSLYTWQDNSTTPVYTVTQAGTYWVSVTDIQHCTASDTIDIVSDCGEIYFPTAFTPNGDGKNEYFGPLGNLLAVKDYQLSVYNRWGQMVFQSTDPFKKWDGTVSATNNTEVNTFTWFAKFSYREQKNIFRKGTITIIR